MTETPIIKKLVHWFANKSLDWFLHDKDLRRKSVKVNQAFDLEKNGVIHLNSDIHFRLSWDIFPYSNERFVENLKAF